MPRVTYVDPDGGEHVVDVPVGQTVMDGSVRSNLPGIVAECGGGCSCATCHVWLAEEYSGHFAGKSDEEEELLEFLDQCTPESRLSCQLVLTAECDGVRVTVPEGNG